MPISPPPSAFPYVFNSICLYFYTVISAGLATDPDMLQKLHLEDISFLTSEAEFIKK